MKNYLSICWSKYWNAQSESESAVFSGKHQNRLPLQGCKKWRPALIKKKINRRAHRVFSELK